MIAETAELYPNPLAVCRQIGTLERELRLAKRLLRVTTDALTDEQLEEAVGRECRMDDSDRRPGLKEATHAAGS